MKIVAKRLSVVRNELGLSQREMAERIGLSHVAYGAFERGKRLPSLDYLMAIAKMAGKSIAYFVGEGEESTTPEAIMDIVRVLNKERQEKILEQAQFQLNKQAEEEAEKKRIFDQMLARIELLAAIEEASVEQRQWVIDYLTDLCYQRWAERAGYDVDVPGLLIDQWRLLPSNPESEGGIQWLSR